MILSNLLTFATDKTQFRTLEDYLAFCAHYLEFIETGLQARIVSQNERHYQFFQYREEGHYNITRPLNSHLMYHASDFSLASRQFVQELERLRQRQTPERFRENIVRVIYTVQQSIGATLDALPTGMSNQARKVNGDLFERLICLLLVRLGVDCVAGTVQVPVKDAAGVELFQARYQHDLLLSKEGELKVIGSVKTSSKDRIDKVFMDKFLYCRLTETSLPHIAIFLNDVQRKKTKHQDEYGISTTFLPGHFKAYTIKLNPLDGVYYCDIRPSMRLDALLSQQIKTIDHLFYVDLWQWLDRTGQELNQAVVVQEDADNEDMGA